MLFTDNIDETDIILKNTFKRRFYNPDSASCWMNSCLQLVLVAMDFEKDLVNALFTSELGLELLYLLSNNNTLPLDPLNVKNIITVAEDTRIAMEISEVEQQCLDKNIENRRKQQIENNRLSLHSGQQCVRDFYICLEHNCLSWPDVYSLFSFKLKDTTQCSLCNGTSVYETTQIYLEIPVPPNGSFLKKNIQEYLNEESIRESYCEDECKKMTEKYKRTTLCNEDCEAKFFIVILTRSVDTVDNNVDCTEDIELR